MAGKTVTTTAIFKAEEQGVHETAAALDKLQGSAGGASRATDEFARTSESSAARMGRIDRSVESLQQRLAGAPAAWRAYERDMAVAMRGLNAGKLSADDFATTIQRLQAQLQKVIAPRLSIDVNSSGLASLLGVTDKISVSTREAANEMLRMADAQQIAQAETARLQQSAAKEVARHAAEIENLRAAYDPAYAAAQRMNREIEQLARLEREGVQIAGGYEAALDRIALKYDEGARAAALAAEQDAKTVESMTAQAARLRAALDPVGAAYEKMTVEIRSYQEMADRQLISQDELALATQRSREAFDQTATSLKPVNDNVRLTANQVQNLGFQLNDAATMLLSGSSPFQVIATQGGQVLQSLQENGGVLASLRAIGEIAVEAAAKGTTALAAMAAAGQAATTSLNISSLATGFVGLVGKINPAVAAITALAGASAYLWYTGRDATRDAEESVESYRKAVEAVQDSYADLGSAIEAAYDKQISGSQRFASARVAGSIATQRAALQSNIDALNDIEGFGVSTGTLGGLSSLWNSRDAAIQDMRDLYGELRRGEQTVEQFQEALAGIRLDSATSDEAKKIADRLLEAADAARQAEARIKALQNAALELKSVRFTEFSGQLDDFIPDTKSSRDRINELADAASRQAISLGQVYEIERKRVAGLAELDRVERNRRAGYELDVRLITAKTAAERADIEAERVRLSLEGETISAAEKARRVEEARALSLTRSQHEIAEATRQRIEAGQAQVDQLQFEMTVVGKSVGEAARLRAEFDMLTAARQAAKDAGTVVDPAEEAAIRSQAAAIAQLTEQTARLDLERGQAEQMRQLQAEAGLIFANDNARRVALAGLEAEAELRRQGIPLNDAWGQSYVENARQIAAMENALDKQTETFESLRDATLDFFDALGSGKGILASLASAFAGFGKQLAADGFDKLFGGLFRSAQPAGNGGSIGSFVSNASAALVEQTNFTAPIGTVTRGALPDLVTGKGFNASQARQVAGQSVPAQMWNFFAGKGLASHQIAGILGNARAESAFNPTAVGDGGAALGLFQWNDRSSALLNSIGGRSNLNNVGAQLDFAWKELQTSESRAYQALLKATNVTEATEAFLGFERPQGYNTGVRNSHNYSGRVQYANEAYSTFGGTAEATKRAVSDGYIDATKRIATGQAGLPSIDGGYSGYGSTGGVAVPTGRPGTAGAGQNGGLFSQAGLQVVGAGLGAFSQGYSTGSPLAGGLGGALSGFGAAGSIASAFPALAGVAGPVGAIAGAAIGILGGIFGGREEREQQHRQQAAQWEAMKPQYEAWQDQLDGVVGGSLRSEFSQLQQEFDTFRETGGAAWKYGTGNTYEDWVVGATKMYNYIGQQMDEFKKNFAAVSADFENGEGLDGAFSQARNSVSDLRDSLLGWIDDISIAFGSADNGLTVGPEVIAAAAKSEAARNEQIAKGQKIAQDSALSILEGSDATSAVVQQIQTLKGTAAGLVDVLQDLGMSADEAAVAVTDSLNKGLLQIRDTFAVSLQDQIDTLDGKDYFAATRDFLETIATTRSDAALLGVDGSLVDTLFQKQAQALVDGAELTGSAFDELIAKFPELSGIVTAFVEDVTQTAEEMRAEAQALANTRYDAVLRDRTDAESALRSEYERTVDRIASLKDFLSDMRLGDDTSILSGQEQFDEAQKLYRETLFKANGGDREAQDQLLGVSQDYLDEARAYYASSEGYGAVYKEIEATLKASATRAETELDVAKRQASFLADIADETKGLSGLVADWLQANDALKEAETGLDQTRDWGVRPVRNQTIVEELRKAGISEYRGDFGPTVGPVGSDWWWSLSMEDRAKAQSIIDANVSKYNYATGGLVTGPGTGTSDSIRANLSNGEYVMPAAAVDRIGVQALDTMRTTMRLPSIAMPVPTRMSSSNDSGALLAEMKALRAEVARLREDNNLVTRAAAEHQREGTDQVASEVRSQRRAGILQAAKAA